MNKSIEELLRQIPDGPDAEEQRALVLKEQAEAEQKAREKRNQEQTASYAHRVNAVVETALAYWRRGKAIQYDSIDLVDAPSRFGGIGSRRSRDYVSPEDCTLDQPAYMVCSTFPFNLFYETVGCTQGMSPDTCRCADQLALTDRSVVYYWRENDGETLEEAARTVRQILRPGDILTSKKKTAHSMMFLGDCLGDGTDYILHSWGGKYNMSTGMDKLEPQGSMTLQSVEEVAFVKGDKARYKANKIPRWSMYDDQWEIVIIRPLRIYGEETYPLTENARARLAHPGLNIDRTASVKPYRTAAVGDRITYTVAVENRSKTDYTDIAVYEPIPEGTALVEAPGAEVSEAGLRWSLEIGAGARARVSFTVRVIGDGEWITAQGGSVAGIRSNCIRTHIGRNLSPEQTAALVENAEKGIEEAYRAIGCELKLSEAVTALWEAVPEQETLLLRRKADPGRLGAMQVPRYQGGRKLTTDGPTDRILEFTEDYLQVGDILVYVGAPMTDAQSQSCYLYLGDGRFLCQNETGISYTEEDVLWQAFTKDLFFCLRPSLTV